ncbi:riboflavin synthase [Companilactobacillus pabuli]|jgi:riboflavin synthase|uniref:Riboflavin synthase n=1 Tax=Companilactobacillus pabuli TaxID=2714036 RepID=A0A7L7KVQ3_9LACO|nr:riboflavin synthase [Companilactobacillus pabuli]AKP04033.1 riboflavin synthase subunit alpha [Companilactobacillus farciminis]AKS52338.1 riboflavin synthase subunit alpha [Companilactobacillus farciminis]MDG5113297.1 riboflavin synthase [Companilactobacillus pabuli]QMT83901.1 riboflavin synthase [Companilactobacillus pabuli]GAQ00401.1 riboflavin synthase subunit alpha [Companilactobacillus farciminis]
MFTGIIKNIGTIAGVNRENDNYRLTINHGLNDLNLGDSVSINGICLTVVDFQKNQFQVDVMPETIKRTNLAEISVGTKVNLEPALKPNSEIGGHFVLGHIDTTGKLLSREVTENSVLLTFSIPKKYNPYLVEKGSIAIDGVSLTLIAVTEDTFQVGIIPYTQDETILGSLEVNQTVNLETDILGKYIYKDLKRGYQDEK